MLQYTVRKNKRAKHLRLRVTGDGLVMVSAPAWLGGRVIEAFVQEKTAWLREKLDLVKLIPQQATQAKRHQAYLVHKEAARGLVEERVAKWNQIYQFPVGRVTIRNQKSRWGSCSSQRNLSFNYRIVHLTPSEQDYIVVHELCHLKEMNHSPRFWALVEKTVPDYRALKHSLRARTRALL